MTSAVAQFYIFIRTSCGNSWDAAVSCIDSNGDGIVTKGELRTFLSDSDTFEYQPVEFEDIWRTIDTHTKGNIGNSKVKNLNALDSSEGAVVQRQIQRYGRLSDAIDTAFNNARLDPRVLERIGGEDKLKYRAVTILADKPNISDENLASEAATALLDAAKKLIHETLTNNTRYTCYTQGLTGAEGQPYSLQDDGDLKGLIDNYLDDISIGELDTDVFDNVEKIIQAYLKSAKLGNFEDPNMTGLGNYQWGTDKLSKLQLVNLTRRYNKALIISQLITIDPFSQFKNNQTKLAGIIKNFISNKQTKWENLQSPVDFNSLYSVSDDAIRAELKEFPEFKTALEEALIPPGGYDDPTEFNIDGIHSQDITDVRSLKEKLKEALHDALGNTYSTEIFNELWNETLGYFYLDNLTDIKNIDVDLFIKIFRALYEMKYKLPKTDKYIQIINLPESIYHNQVNNNDITNPGNKTQYYENIKKNLEGINRILVDNNGSLMQWANKLCDINGIPFNQFKEKFKQIGLDLTKTNAIKTRYRIPSDKINKQELADQFVKLFSADALIIVQQQNTNIDDYFVENAFQSKINILDGIKMRDFTNFTDDFNSAVKTNFTNKITYPGEGCGYKQNQWENAVTTLENYLEALFKACADIRWNQSGHDEHVPLNEDNHYEPKTFTFEDSNGNEHEFNNLGVYCYNIKNNSDAENYFNDLNTNNYNNATSGMYIVCDYNAMGRNRFYVALDGNTMWSLFKKFLGY